MFSFLVGIILIWFGGLGLWVFLLNRRANAKINKRVERFIKNINDRGDDR